LGGKNEERKKKKNRSQERGNKVWTLMITRRRPTAKRGKEGPSRIASTFSKRREKRKRGGRRKRGETIRPTKNHWEKATGTERLQRERKKEEWKEGLPTKGPLADRAAPAVVTIDQRSVAEELQEETGRHLLKRFDPNEGKEASLRTSGPE